MPNDLIPADMEVAQDSDGYALVIHQGVSIEKYYMDKEPKSDSSLVLVGKSAILNELNLDRLVEDMQLTADLLFLAYMGTADAPGGEIQAKIQGLQEKLARACNQAIETINEFQFKTTDVLGYLLKAHKWLLEGEEKVALKQLQRCEESAGIMAEKAKTLADTFKNLEVETNNVYMDTIKVRGAQQDKLKELQKQINESQAALNGLKEMQGEILNSINDLQEKYAEAKAEEEKDKDRQMIMGIFSAITSVLSAGVAPFQQVKNILSSNADQVIAENRASHETEKNTLLKTIEQEIKDGEVTLLKAEEELSHINSRIRESEASTSNGSHSESTTETEDTATEEEENSREGSATGTNTILLKEKEDKEKEINQIKEALQSAKNRLQAETENMQEVQAALASAEQAVVASKDRAREILKAKNDMDKMKIINMGKIAEQTGKLASMQAEQGITESTVASLDIAAKALANVVTILLDASLFWGSMQQYCKDLSKSKMTEMIADVQDLSQEKRLKEYTAEDFMFTSVSYIARWKALNIVCQEYIKAVMNTRAKVLVNIEKSPSLAESRSLAPRLAVELNAKTLGLLQKAEERIRENEELAQPA